MIGRLAMLTATAWMLAMPAQAASDCKQPIFGRARSTAPVADAERQRLALDDAIAHWRQQARLIYGFDYRYWQAARNKRVQCTGSAGLRKCAVQARPCKVAS